jgi:Tol biopolymer transport system component
MALSISRMTAVALGGALFLLSASACAGSEDDAIDAKGTVAFVSGAQWSAIFLASSDESRPRQLTQQRSRHHWVNGVAWSPDGSKIAYSGGSRGWDDNAYDHLWVIRAGGGLARRLTRNREDDWSPAWSPNGRKLAFDRQGDGYNWIYVVNADGTGLRKLTANFNYHPTWSPDGRITYVNGRGIWVMSADGSGKRLLAWVRIEITGYMVPPPATWSPDGTRVAYTTGTALWVMDADGTHRRKLYGDPKRETREPVWSPDGKTIAWSQGEGDLEVFVIDADGSGLRNLTDNERIQDEAPAWSSNGRALAFVRRTLDDKTDVYVMNADGSGQRNLSESPTNDWSPVWSP